MQKKKIVLAGGTGFVGQYLKEQYSSLGFDVIIIARGGSNIGWGNHGAIQAALENTDMLINLAGKSVDCRYNEKNKREILLSRTETTRQLGESILKCANPPKLWINSSTATIYRHAMDRPMTEDGGEIGTGFSVGVAKQWEETFYQFRLPDTRQVALRMAIVLGREGGVLRALMNLVKYGLGGTHGSGKQMFSWIHLEDLFTMIEFIRTNESLSGNYNCCAPAPVDNATLMRSLRQHMNVSIGIPSPKWMLELGAVFIRTETELVLKSRWVLPERITKEGFQFSYPTLDDALKNIIR